MGDGGGEFAEVGPDAIEKRMHHVRGRPHAVGLKLPHHPLLQIPRVEGKHLVDLARLAELGHQFRRLLFALQRLRGDVVDHHDGHAGSRRFRSRKDVRYRVLPGALRVGDDDNAVVTEQRGAGRLRDFPLGDVAGFQPGNLGLRARVVSHGALDG